MKAYFSEIKSEIRSQIQKAKNEILVAVAWITDEDLIRDLGNKAGGGLDVELVISNSVENFTNRKPLKDFVQKGGKLYIGNEDRLIHHKFCIIDKSLLINGSYNWTYYAEKKNEENIVVFNNTDDTKLLFNQFGLRFKKLTRDYARPIANLSELKTVDTQAIFRELDAAEIKLRKEFEEELISALEETRRLKIPINHQLFYDLMEKYGGGTELAKKLINDSRLTGELKSGFVKLFDAKKLDLSIEYISLKKKYQSLFNKDELEFCFKKMKEFKITHPDID